MSKKHSTSDPTVLAGDSPAIEDAETEEVGRVLAGRWELLSLLGMGGMGAVYRARDRELDEVVALKMLRAGTTEPGAIERLRREVKLSRRVSHRNVARVFELGESEGERFFTLEYIEGESLRALLDRELTLSIPRALELGVAMAKGLAAAHEVGVVHRDLKPDNVLLGRDGRVAITDFGIAASFERTGAAETTSFAGTPLYMAPEQVDHSRPITQKSDVYALGAVLFELLTGRPPFHEATALATAAARLTRPAPDPRSLRPELGSGLADLVLSCLAKNPDDRPASAALVQAALESQLGAAGPVISVKPPPGSEALSVPLAASSGTVSPWSARAKPRARLAVLPLLNGGTEADAYMADGLTDDLIDSLSTVNALRVMSRSATERYAGMRAVDPRAVGAELNVDVIVSGSLRRVEDGSALLSLRLIACEDGGQLWSQRFQVAASRLLQVNTDAAHAIASALSLAGGRDERRLTDPAAVELYLRARAMYREFSPRGARTSAELFERALAFAPEDPVLLAGHAMALARVSFFKGDRVEAAHAAAAHALAIAPDLGEAHLAMATVELQRANMPQAFREALAALRFSPSLAEAHQLVGRILAETGPIDAAQRALALAVEIEPRMGLTQVSQMQLLVYSGRSQEAMAMMAEARKAVGEQTTFQVARARFAFWMGNRDETNGALAEIERLSRTSQQPSYSLFLTTLAADPEKGLALAQQPEMLAQLERESRRLSLFVLQVLCEFAGGSNAVEQGIMLLGRAVSLGLCDQLWMDGCPVLASLRAAPGWADLYSVVAARAAEVRALVPKSGGTTTKP